MTPSPSDERIRELAGEILRRRDYTQWRPVEWFGGFLDWLSRLPRENPSLHLVLLVSLILVAVVLIVHITLAIRAALAVPAASARETATAGGPRFVEEAEGLAADGRFLEAGRRLQLAVIELLLRRRIVALTRSDPNRILRARLRDAPLPDAERRDLLGLLDRFERSWFRDGSADRSLYEAWHDVHARLAAVRDAE